MHYNLIQCVSKTRENAIQHLRGNERREKMLRCGEKTQVDLFSCLYTVEQRLTFSLALPACFCTVFAINAPLLSAILTRRVRKLVINIQICTNRIPFWRKARGALDKIPFYLVGRLLFALPPDTRAYEVHRRKLGEILKAAARDTRDARRSPLRPSCALELRADFAKADGGATHWRGNVFFIELRYTRQ